MATNRQERRERDALRSFRLSIANTCISVLVLAFTIYWPWHQKRSYDTQFASMRTSIMLLTATVAPQLQKAIDDSLVSVLSSQTLPSKANDVLAQVASDTRSLRSLEAKLPSNKVAQTSSTLEKALRSYPDSLPGWDAAAEMVSYRSGLREPMRQLPDCYATEGGGGAHLADLVMRYHDCNLNLNDVAGFNAVATKIYQPGPDGKIKAWGQVSETILLTNGNVSYSGGQLIGIQRLSLQNCTFDLLGPSSLPPTRGRALTNQLLLADLSNVTLILPKTEA